MAIVLAQLRVHGRASGAPTYTARGTAKTRPTGTARNQKITFRMFRESSTLMRIATRSVSRATASSMVVAAALALVGFQATEQTASAATKKAPSVVTCTAANTKLTVTEVSRPINHLLLKATNTGSKPCNAYIAPYLRAGADAQAPLAWAEETTPQAVVTLEHGQSAYAGITTSTPDGEGGAKEKTLGVIFTDRKGNATDKETTLKLPQDGVFFNSTAIVTYWQDNAKDALSW
ncbi:DUF4232 domain-containing protein [Streptomyces yokosukanensis]|nr:DUF4232 domain-containing protein [Streptomyces yokosukanensis]